MTDTCAEYSRALAYIVRHGLLYNKSAILDEWQVGTGNGDSVYGDTLYQAVLNYQERSGIGWGE